MEDLQKLLGLAKEAAIAGGKEILDVYNTADFGVEIKGDNSPLTLADKRAHLEIEKFLKSSNLPILSEEGKEVSFDVRKDWDLFWMVDPLDGTKEFIKRNGEFTVNIALIQGGLPILGVVYCPVLNKLYYASKGTGAYVLNLEKGTGSEKIEVSGKGLDENGLKVVASRSHLNEATQQFLDGLNNPEIVSMGSSLKLLAVAEGEADVYPRYAPTMEWDTAAAHAIVSEAGGLVLIKGEESQVVYNKENLLNPEFLVKS